MPVGIFAWTYFQSQHFWRRHLTMRRERVPVHHNTAFNENQPECGRAHTPDTQLNTGQTVDGLRQRQYITHHTPLHHIPTLCGSGLASTTYYCDVYRFRARARSHPSSPSPPLNMREAWTLAQLGCDHNAVIHIIRFVIVYAMFATCATMWSTLCRIMRGGRRSAARACATRLMRLQHAPVLCFGSVRFVLQLETIEWEMRTRFHVVFWTTMAVRPVCRMVQGLTCLARKIAFDPLPLWYRWERSCSSSAHNNLFPIKMAPYWVSAASLAV